MNAIYFLLGLFIFLWLMQVIVARSEKRQVWAYGDLGPAPHFEDPGGYGARTVHAATNAGFTFLGWAADRKGGRYQLSYGFLVSPERDSLVIVGIGKLIGMKMAGTWIHTPATDGTSFYSVDHQNCVEMDVTGVWKGQLVPHSRFETLWRKHREGLSTRKSPPRQFPPGRELEVFHEVREEHYRSVARKGYIAFTDKSEAHWRYTTVGAMKWATLSYSIGLVRGITSGRVPRIA